MHVVKSFPPPPMEIWIAEFREVPGQLHSTTASVVGRLTSHWFAVHARTALLSSSNATQYFYYWYYVFVLFWFVGGSDGLKFRGITVVCVPRASLSRP